MERSSLGVCGLAYTLQIFFLLLLSLDIIKTLPNTLLKGLIMKCIYTGLETTNLYKSKPVHPDILDLARDLIDDKESPFNNMRDALEFLAASIEEYNKPD